MGVYLMVLLSIEPYLITLLACAKACGLIEPVGRRVFGASHERHFIAASLPCEFLRVLKDSLSYTLIPMTPGNNYVFNDRM